MEELPRCEKCGQVLERLMWNTRGDILICNNGGCDKFHTPQGFIKEYRSMEKIMELIRQKSLERSKGRGKS